MPRLMCNACLRGVFHKTLGAGRMVRLVIISMLKGYNYSKERGSFRGDELRQGWGYLVKGGVFLKARALRRW